MKSKIIHPKQKHIIDIYGREPATLDEVAEAVLAVMQHSTEGNIAGLSWNVLYSSSVSNTHSCPIDGVKNWSRLLGPIGYPGWTGRVWIRYHRRLKNFGSDGFFQTLTYTGTGGWGNYDGPWRYLLDKVLHCQQNQIMPAIEIPDVITYSYDFHFFLDDWPQLVQYVERQAILALLADQYPSYGIHKFHWEDPKVSKLDRKFINNIDIFT